MLHHEALLQLS